MRVETCSCVTLSVTGTFGHTLSSSTLTSGSRSHANLERSSRASIRRRQALLQRACQQVRGCDVRLRIRCNSPDVGGLHQSLSGRRSIRHLQKKDAEAIVQLQATAFYESWGNAWVDTQFSRLFKADVRSIVAQKWYAGDDKFQCFVATQDVSSDHVIGIVEVSLQSSQEVLMALAAQRGETYAYVACMAVDEAFRRQGIALQLLKAAEKHAKSWKQCIVALHVYKTNTVAIKTYERAGYTLLKEDGAWRTLFGAKQRILMFKNL